MNDVQALAGQLAYVEWLRRYEAHDWITTGVIIMLARRIRELDAQSMYPLRSVPASDGEHPEAGQDL